MSAAQQLAKEKRKSLAKKLVGEFRLKWKAIQGPILAEEVTFCERKWRFDFAHHPSKIAVEIEGGIWTGGRHTRGKGFEEDCEKYNEAQYQGWDVHRFTEGQITWPNLERLAKHMRAVAAKSGNNYPGA